jgi:hypothetical protein
MASSPVPLVNESTLRDLASAGVLEAVTAAPRAGGFEVRVKFGNAEPALGNAKGEPKLYASLDTIAAQLLKLGIKTFTVNAEGYKPGLVRAPRPDRAEALRRAGAGQSKRQLAKKTK